MNDPLPLRDAVYVGIFFGCAFAPFFVLMGFAIVNYWRDHHEP